MNILEINSDKSKLCEVEKFLGYIFDENNIDKKYYNRVLLCISEAVINSIEHGNKNDINKIATIKVNCDLYHINVEVKDEGEGFDL